MITCHLCEEEIAKYGLDFDTNGGIIIGKSATTICLNCRKRIAKGLIDEL